MIRVLEQHLVDQIFDVSRVLIFSKSIVVHILVFLFYLIESVLSFLALERELSANQSVEYDACRPYIYFFVVSFSVQNFRGYVCRGSTHIIHVLSRYGHFRKPEVDNFNSSNLFCQWIFLNQNILRFEVPMCYTTSMQVLDGFKKLVHDSSNLFLLQLIGFDVFVKLSTCDLLHYDEHILLRFVSFLQLNYILMVDHFDYRNFIPQEFFLSVCQSRLVNLLDSQQLATVPILALVNS